MECSVSMAGTGTRLAKAGFAVHGMDYEGHGKSDGLQGYISSFQTLVDDCHDYFTSICETAENRNKKRFLLGESMGGAVAIMLHRKDPSFWNGAVLVAPMCKISDEMKPHPMVISFLEKLSKVIPKWKIIPIKDILEIGIKDPQHRQKVRDNPLCYKGKPRLLTGKELITVSIDIEKNLDKVSMPFLVVHGGDDVVTDPSISQLLYDKASSSDKTFKLYPNMWHALTSGEPIENINTVFNDIISWLDERSPVGDAILSEMEQKASCDIQTKSD